MHRVACEADWITTTWPFELKDTPMGDEMGMVNWVKSKAAEHGKGIWVKPWAWNGYVGRQVGPVSWGERLDGSILRLSSTAAHHWLYDNKPIGHNISRLDIAITVWDAYDIDGQIALHKDEALLYRDRLQSRPFGVNHIAAHGDGDTLYVGSRSSAVFIRIYNKEKEQKGNPDYASSIRYEIEFKEQAARAALDAIGGRRYRSVAPLEFALSIFAGRGIRPLGSNSATRTLVVYSRMVESDATKSLGWLEEQVSPTVRRLVAAGYAAEVKRIFGL